MDHIVYKKAESYVTALFDKIRDPGLVFHNLQHTMRVVERTKEIALQFTLSERQMLTVYIAAWFHDTGYLYVDAEQHEEKSIELMRIFMREYTEEEALVNEIAACIQVTKHPRNPTQLLEEIICDADTYHFGTREFKDTNKRVYEEICIKKGYMEPEMFRDSTMEVLSQHRFYTTYCQELLDEKKMVNMKKLQKKSEELAEKNGGALRIKESGDLPTKGVQTMLRLTSSNHLELSGMADQKANILISVNAIIISVILGVLLRKLQEDPYLIIPSMIFLTVSVTTIVIAIMATRPMVSGGTFSEQDVIDKKTNLLFFGNFHKAPFDQYNNAMRKMMRDPDYLYGALINDIYQLAVVLGRKYRLVRLAYNIFMYGIVASVLSFAIAIFFYSTQTGAAGGTVPGTSGGPL